MIDRLTSTLDFNAKALLLRTERQKVLAGNIANADTPRYKAMDFDFAAALGSATQRIADPSTGLSQPANAPAPSLLRVSSDAHIATAQSLGSTTAHLQYRKVGQPSMDGNTVDRDVEQAQFADNTVRYEASLKFLNGQISTLLSAIKG
jgi:flagellar basal-body rod protein FlgB